MKADKPLTKTEADTFNSVTLAFLGDAVYSLYVREKLVRSGEGKAADYQKAAANIVSAKGQSLFLDELIPLFTEEEEAIFRRGKNAKKATKSKSATSLEYSRSTGFEAVIGYLYLTGQEERLETLLSKCDDALFHVVKTAQAFKPIRH